ncbi:hypothetical protein BH09PSE1_BH09PSE1_24350 [soil metagenome]
MAGLLGFVLAGVLSIQTAPAGPPIFQPGAPGQASRIVTTAEALELGRTSFTPADVAFMQHMLVHHAQAVEMVALMDDRGENPRVRLMGRRIALSQEAEMAIMRGWLSDRGQSLEMAGMDHSAHAAMDHPGMDHSGMAGMAGMDHAGMGPAPAATDPADIPVMAGMLTPRQMSALSQAHGAAFDQLFLTGMIQHHRGALSMVSDLMDTPNASEDTVMSEFTTSVVADQQAEILRMQSLLSDF